MPAEVTVAEAFLPGPPDLHGDHGASSCCGPEVLLRAHRVIGEVAVQEIDGQLVNIIPASILADSLYGRGEEINCKISKPIIRI